MQLISGQGLDAVIEDLTALRAEHSGGLVSGSGSSAESGRNQSPSIAASLMSGRFREENLGAESDGDEANFPPGPSDAAALRVPVRDSQSAAATETVAVQSSTTSSAALPGESELSTAETNRRAYFQSVAQIGRQTASALAYAHARGIIHRDIKPSNLILDATGVVWVTDFGLAKTGDSAMTHTGDILGTIRYMSPERFRGQCDVRVDVYSLGLTLYEMLTLKPAFESLDRLKLIEMVSNSQPPSLRSIDPRIPRDLETIVFKSIDKEPKRRYQSADELHDDLQRFIDDEPIQARRTSSAERFVRWCRRNPIVATLAATAGSLLLFLAVAGPLIAISKAKLAAKEAAARTREATAHDDLRRQLYVADMNLASQAWDVGDAGRVLPLLAKHRPSSEQEDLRQFEWYYLWQRCRGALMSFDHGGNINRAAISPDGNLLVTIGWDGSIKMWNLHTGKLLDTRNGEGVRVRVAFSPDGTMLASGGRTLRLWQLQGQQLVDTSRIDSEHVVAKLAFSPDGEKLATAHGDGSIMLWDIASKGKMERKIERPDAHDDPVRTLAFTPYGLTLATAGEDNVVKLWNVDRNEIKFLKSQEKHTDNVHRVAFSRDGRTLASASADGSVILWDISSGDTRRLSAPQTEATSLPFSPDGTMLAASFSGDCMARIWDLPSYEEREPLKGHSANINTCVFSPTNDTLVTSCFDGTAKLWDVATKDRNILKGHDDQWVNALAFCPSGQTLVSGSEDGTLGIWDVKNGECLSKVTTGKLHSLAIDADGKTLATGDSEGWVTLWNFATGNEPTMVERYQKHKTRVSGIALSPDGHTIASASYDIGGQVRLWDVKTGVDVHPVPTAPGSSSIASRDVAISPSGRILAVGGADGNVELWDVKTGYKLATLPGHTSGIPSVSFSHDGRLLATGSLDTTAILWNVSTRQRQWHFKSHYTGVQRVKFSPDDKTLISSSWEGRVILWDVATGEERFHFEHGKPVVPVAMSPTGRVLASAGIGGTIKLWRAATEQQVQAAGEWWNR